MTGERYTVDADGRITDPGKFEGERRYVPYFWDLALDGLGDEIEGGIVSIRISADDKLRFPELKRRMRVRLHERSDGFVVEVGFDGRFEPKRAAMRGGKRGGKKP